MFKINEEIINWKGTTFQRISAGIKFNNPSAANLFRAGPLKIYRKEIASSTLQFCRPRTSTRIDDFNMPGGTVTTSIHNNTGLANIDDFNSPNNSCEHPSSNDICSSLLSPEINALRRVRSSGMIKPKFNANLNNDTYYTNSAQYLTKRNRTFDQNRYFHIRTGDDTAKPGSSDSIQNVYSANGLSDCIKYTIATATSFAYIWVDGTTNTVIVPTGSYGIDDFNNLLHTAMAHNYHYYLKTPFNTNLFLLNFEFDMVSNKVVIQSLVTNGTIHSQVNGYSYPAAQPALIIWTTHIPSAPLAANASIVLSSPLTQAFGFAAGTYPLYQNNTTDQYIYGVTSSQLNPTYFPIYYKPNNSQFAVQGAVSSGDFINRKKYDTITTVGASFRSAYGAPTANAVAYGSSMYGYTLKDKLGYPNKKTPTFSQTTGGMIDCDLKKISNSN